MDQLVNAIQAFSSNRKDWSEVKKLLLKEKAILSKGGQQLDAVLEMFGSNLRLYTIASTMLLSFKLKKDMTDEGLFVQQAKTLLIHANVDQVLECQTEFAEVCQQFALNSIMVSRTAEAILPLQRAIELLQNGNRNLLTPAHKDFVLMCIKAKNYNAAASILDVPIYEVTKRNGLQPVDYLGYHYYGGVAYIGLKKFEKALEFFQLVLTAPSRALSAIQIYSMQKYILVSLIVHGEYVSLPRKITSMVVSKGTEKRSQLYMYIAQAFKKGVEDLRRVIEENHEELKKDKNFGLAKQTITSLVRRNIKRLTNTYLILPLAEIAERADLPSAAEAEQHVLRMIEDGAIYATINHREGTVSFQEHPEHFDSSSAVAQLDQKIKEAEDLDRRLRKLDQELQLDPRFIKKNLSGAADPRKGSAMPRDMEDMQLQEAMRASLVEK